MRYLLTSFDVSHATSSPNSRPTTPNPTSSTQAIPHIFYPCPDKVMRNRTLSSVQATLLSHQKDDIAVTSTPRPHKSFIIPSLPSPSLQIAHPTPQHTKSPRTVQLQQLSLTPPPLYTIHNFQRLNSSTNTPNPDEPVSFFPFGT